MMLLLQLFWEYFKTGLFAVGGGLATLPFLADIADKTGWFTHAELADMIAVSESTPGPIGVNMATYVGFKTAGIPGAFVATFGLVLPSVLIIIIIAGFLEAFRTNKYVDSAFYGIRPASTALITAAWLSLMLTCVITWAEFRSTGAFADILDIKAVILFALIFLMCHVIKKTKKLHPILFVAISAAAGIIFSF